MSSTVEFRVLEYYAILVVSWEKMRKIGFQSADRFV